MATARSLSVKRSHRPTIAEWSQSAVSMHSEKLHTAVLRAGRSPRDPWLGVCYRDRQVQMELRCGGESLWSGAWRLEIRRGGRAVRPVSEWEEVLWISDEGVDYLELSSQFSEGIHVERQILLAQDGFVLLADVLVAQQPAKLDYRSSLPLAPGIRFNQGDENREGILEGRRRRAMVLPLALPEWRAQPAAGSLAPSEHGLELRQAAKAAAMFAPLFVDLQPGRFRRPLTWRQLTVAENLAIQPTDVAAGFRVQVGRQQWLIYRSLAAKANRTLLGHNLSSEMLVARFQRKGEIEALVEIE